MVAFDEQRKYQGKEETFFDDGREIELLHFVYGKPNMMTFEAHPERSWKQSTNSHEPRSIS